jgi:hypothetical protein
MERGTIFEAIFTASDNPRLSIMGSQGAKTLRGISFSLTYTGCLRGAKPLFQNLFPFPFSRGRG